MISKLEYIMNKYNVPEVMLANELGLTRQAINLRKKQGLTIKDLVTLQIATRETEFKEIISKYQAVILKDTLSKDIIWQEEILDGADLKVNGIRLFVKIEK